MSSLLDVLKYYFMFHTKCNMNLRKYILVVLCPMFYICQLDSVVLSAFHLLNEALSITSSSTKHQVKIARISNFDDSFVCLSYQNMLVFHV